MQREGSADGGIEANGGGTCTWVRPLQVVVQLPGQAMEAGMGRRHQVLKSNEHGLVITEFDPLLKWLPKELRSPRPK